MAESYGKKIKQGFQLNRSAYVSIADGRVLPSVSEPVRLIGHVGDVISLDEAKQHGFVKAPAKKKTTKKK